MCVPPCFGGCHVCDRRLGQIYRRCFVPFFSRDKCLVAIYKLRRASIKIALLIQIELLLLLFNLNKQRYFYTYLMSCISYNETFVVKRLPTPCPIYLSISLQYSQNAYHFLKHKYHDIYIDT